MRGAGLRFTAKAGPDANSGVSDRRRVVNGVRWQLWTSLALAAFAVVALAAGLLFLSPADLAVGRTIVDVPAALRAGELPPMETPTPEPGRFEGQRIVVAKGEVYLNAESAAEPNASDPRCSAQPVPVPSPTPEAPANAQPPEQPAQPTPANDSAGLSRTFRICGGADDEKAAREIERLTAGRSFSASLVSVPGGCADLTITLKSSQSAGSGSGTRVQSSSTVSLSVSSPVAGQSAPRRITVEITSRNGETTAKIHSGPITALPTPSLPLGDGQRFGSGFGPSLPSSPNGQAPFAELGQEWERLRQEFWNW